MCVSIFQEELICSGSSWSGGWDEPCTYKELPYLYPQTRIGLLTFVVPSFSREFLVILLYKVLCRHFV